MHMSVVDLFRLGDPLDHQNHGTPHCRHIDRFECRIQDQYRFLHNGRFSCDRGYGTRRALIAPGLRQGYRPGKSTALARRFHSPRSRYGTDKSAATTCGNARATVRPTTRLAPACLRAREQASRVAPVVNTSSTSKTRSLSTWAPSCAP